MSVARVSMHLMNVISVTLSKHAVQKKPTAARLFYIFHYSFLVELMSTFPDAQSQCVVSRPN